MHPFLKTFALAGIFLATSCNNDKEKTAAGKFQTAIDSIINSSSRSKDTLAMIRNGEIQVKTLFKENTLPLAKLVQAEAAIDQDSTVIVPIRHIDSSTGKAYWFSVQKENPADKHLHDYDAIQKQVNALSTFLSSKEFSEETRKAQKQMNKASLDLLRSFQKGTQKSYPIDGKIFDSILKHVPR